MKRLPLALLLAAAIIGIALLAAFDIVPEEVAQFAPFMLMALFPAAWLTNKRCCSAPERVNP